MGNIQVITVKLTASVGPMISRIFAILKDRIQQRCLSDVVQVEDDAQMILAVSDDLPSEAFRIDQVGDAVRIASGSPRGLLYGVGNMTGHSSLHPGGGSLFRRAPCAACTSPRTFTTGIMRPQMRRSCATLKISPFGESIPSAFVFPS
jgi:hypothetical protein